MKYAALCLALLLAGGCATTEEMAAHRDSIAAWERVEIARANANAKKYDVMREVATRGDASSQIALVLALVGLGQPQPQQTAPMPAPPDPEMRVYRWASILLPSATAITAGYFGYRLGVTQSDNAALTSIAGYGTMSALGTTGMGTTRDVAAAGFAAIGSMPQGITMNVAAGGAGAIGGSASVDASRRCAPSYSQPVALQGAAGAFAPGSTSYANPFNC